MLAAAMINPDRASRMWIGWLVALSVLLSLMLLQATAHAEASFTLVADPTQPALPAGSTLAAVADLTGEHIPDLIVETPQADTLGVILGNGAGTFEAPSSIALAGHPLAPRIADFNGDGHPDLLVPGQRVENNADTDSIETGCGGASGGRIGHQGSKSRCVRQLRQVCVALSFCSISTYIHRFDSPCHSPCVRHCSPATSS